MWTATSEWATIQDLSDFALPYGVTQGLYWQAAIFREADFSFPIRLRRNRPSENHRWGRDIATVIRVAARCGMQVTQPSGPPPRTPCTIAKVVSETVLRWHSFRSYEVRFWLIVVAYNLGNLWRGASVVEEDRQLLGDDLAATLSQDRRTAGETYPLSLAAVGRGTSNSEVVWKHAGKVIRA